MGQSERWNPVNRDFKILETQEKKSPITSLIRLSNTQIVAGYPTGALLIRDLKENKTLSLNHSEKPLQPICRLTDTTFISNDKETLKIWNLNHSNSNPTKTLNEKNVTAIEVIEPNEIIIFGNSDGDIKTINIKNNYKIELITQLNGPINIIKKIDDKNLLIYCHNSSTLQQYNIANEKN